MRSFLLLVLSLQAGGAPCAEAPFGYRCHFDGEEQEAVFQVDEARGLVNGRPATFSRDAIRLEAEGGAVTATILIDRRTGGIKSLARPFDIVVGSGSCTRTDRSET